MTFWLAFIAAVLGVLGLGELIPERAGRRPKAARVLVTAGHVLRRRVGARAPASLTNRIAAAGLTNRVTARDVMAAKLAAAALGSAAGLILAAPAPGRLGLALLTAGPIGGFLAPDAWLARRARERARDARAELPALLDLLRVSVEAGLSPAQALAEVGERTSGPMAAEWRAVSRETRLGVPLAAALNGLTQRLPLPEVLALAGALERAGRHGAPLGDTPAAQARDARLARRRRIEEQAAKAGPKIQLVVALLLVPSVLLLVAAALAAAMLDGHGAQALGV
jgi:tight adherence protein C